MEYVYVYIHPDHGYVYIGRTSNLTRRITEHDSGKKDNISNEYKELLAASSVYYIEVGNKAEAISVEAYLINKHKPMLNKALKYDGSSSGIVLQLPSFKKLSDTVRAKRNSLNDELQMLELQYKNEYGIKMKSIEDAVSKKAKERNDYISKLKELNEELITLKGEYAYIKRNVGLFSSALKNRGDRSKHSYDYEEAEYFLKHIPMDVEFSGGAYDLFGNKFMGDIIIKRDGDTIRTYDKDIDITGGIFTDVCRSAVRFAPNIDIESLFCELLKNRELYLNQQIQSIQKWNVTIQYLLNYNGNLHNMPEHILDINEDFNVYITKGGYLAGIRSRDNKINLDWFDFFYDEKKMCSIDKPSQDEYISNEDIDILQPFMSIKLYKPLPEDIIKERNKVHKWSNRRYFVADEAA